MGEPPIFVLTDRSSWRDIKAWFLSGNVAGFPAEYSYALSEVPARRPFGEQFRLHRIKDRSEKKPILYLAGSLDIVRRFAKIPHDQARARCLADPQCFVTVLLPARSLAIALGMSCDGKVAFRIPTDPNLRNFLVYLGEPLSGTSLNRSGLSPLQTVEEIQKSFPGLALVDGGFRPGFPVSPILDLVSFDRKMRRGSWQSVRSSPRSPFHFGHP